MSRTLKRSVARAHYNKFAKLWREDLRISGQYGQTNSPKRPPFNQWYAMHQKNLEMTKESTPADVQEYLSAQDPWADPAGRDVPAGTHTVLGGPEFDGYAGPGEKNEQRGMTTMDIATGKEDSE